MTMQRFFFSSDAARPARARASASAAAAASGSGSASASAAAFARVLWLALVLTGCGGGVESGGTGGTSFTSGTITGFGSVIVGGVHYDDSTAVVTDSDGALRSRDDLRLGMSTEIRGSAIAIDAGGTRVGSAAVIRFGSEIVGRIDSLDVAGKRLVALGQPVDIGATTVFDDASVSGGLAALRVGDVIEVYGLLDAASGHYAATRIERKGSNIGTYALRGVVARLDAAARTFSIGSARIAYGASASAVPATLANGSLVRVRLQPAQVGGVWTVATLNDGVRKPDDAEQARIEGVVSAFTSAARFSVDGVAVDASGANPPGGLALGVRVEVEGRSGGGVLTATQVKIRTSGDVAGEDFELRGLVAAPDAARSSFVLRGVSVTYALATTEFRNGTPAALALGANIEARGMLSADGTRLVATRITFR